MAYIHVRFGEGEHRDFSKINGLYGHASVHDEMEQLIIGIEGDDKVQE